MIIKYRTCPGCLQAVGEGDRHDCPNPAAQEALAKSSTDYQNAFHFDTGKSPMELIPLDLLRDVAQVYYEVSVKPGHKYPPNNWRVGNFRHGAIMGSTLRHLEQHESGRLLDLCIYDREHCNTLGPDATCSTHTGLPHLLLAQTNLLILWYVTKHKLGNNDLWGWQEWLPDRVKEWVAGTPNEDVSPFREV